ncbi:hypothetical protein AGMMS49975_26890 [Clostridia bacterium]|nr:hypothetical protein AGMMS49975_26890 [Clostridia bacterium]
MTKDILITEYHLNEFDGKDIKPLTSRRKEEIIGTLVGYENTPENADKSADNAPHLKVGVSGSLIAVFLAAIFIGIIIKHKLGKR